MSESTIPPYTWTMCTEYRREKSLNGQPLDVLKSAVQKYIRRGQIDKAMAAVAELDLFALTPGGEKLRTNLLHRLMIIFLEDVGNLQWWGQVHLLIFGLWEWREARVGIAPSHEKFHRIRQREQEALGRLTQLMCESTHTRQCSHLRFCFQTFWTWSEEERTRWCAKFPILQQVVEQWTQWTASPPVVETLTAEAKELQPVLSRLEPAGLQAVHRLAAALQDRREVAFRAGHEVVALIPKLPARLERSTDPVFLIMAVLRWALERRDRQYGKFVDWATRWYKELKPHKESFLCWYTLIVLHLTTDQPPHPSAPYVGSDIHEIYRRNLAGQLPTWDEWVYDQHTRLGRERHSSSTYFATESSWVIRETPTTDPRYKEPYMAWKLAHTHDQKETETSAPKRRKLEHTSIETSADRPEERESDFVEFLVRAQLVTSNHKTDTYFGRLRHSSSPEEVVFVKGPFLDATQVDRFLAVQAIKAQSGLGLATTTYQSVWLIPDLFPQPILSLRKKVDRQRAYPFVYTTLLFTERPVPTKMHSSTMWPATEVVDWSRITSVRHFQFATDSRDPVLMRAYAEHVIWRYLMGIGDLADRNFLVRDHQVFSIDEDVTDKDFLLESHLKHRYAAMMLYLRQHPEVVDKFRDVVPARWAKLQAALIS